MAFRDYFPAASWILRRLTGRLARRFYLCIILSLPVVSTVVRVRTYLMTRRIQSVISGLSKLRIDESTEEEVLRTVPYLVGGQRDWQVKRTIETGDVDTGTVHDYFVAISNESSWMRFEIFASRFSSFSYTKDDRPKSWILDFADMLGYRYLSFGARVWLLDGKVSRISYRIADRVTAPRLLGDIISVTSVHAYWAPLQSAIWVSSMDDESPQFRIRAGDRNLSVSYTSDAPPALTSHAFQVDLSCFWRLLGCRDAGQIAPLVWQDKNSIEAATLVRLESKDPCPDRILAGRIKYLPDIDVALLEATGVKSESVNEDGFRVDEIWTKFKLIEVLRGRSSKSWEDVRSTATIPYPGDFNRRLTNMGLQWAKAGDRVLAFSNHGFDSCRIVAATPSALSTVRNTVPAPRHWEDEIQGKLL